MNPYRQNDSNDLRLQRKVRRLELVLALRQLTEKRRLALRVALSMMMYAVVYQLVHVVAHWRESSPHGLGLFLGGWLGGQMSQYTRQGVRNLDSLGPRPKRGHVGRLAEQDQLSCMHIWQDVGRETGKCWIWGACTCPSQRCKLCGAVR